MLVEVSILLLIEEVIRVGMLAPSLALPLATVYAKALTAFLFTVTDALLTVVTDEHVNSK